MAIAIVLFLAASVLDPLRVSELSKPVLVYKGCTAGAPHYRLHSFAVSNYTDYPDDLFERAPDLPPCGRNSAAARTWVDIFDNTGRYIGGFCALQAATELQDLKFTVPEGQPTPAWIRVVLHDRRTGRKAEARLEIPAS